MSLGKSVWKETRQRLQELLSSSCPTLKDNSELRKKYVIKIKMIFIYLTNKL
jgi:RNase P subunit RPR2